MAHEEVSVVVHAWLRSRLNRTVMRNTSKINVHGLVKVEAGMTWSENSGMSKLNRNESLDVDNNSARRFYISLWNLKFIFMCRAEWSRDCLHLGVT